MNDLSPQFLFDFFSFNGDANQDRYVNALDFNILASNFGKTGRSFANSDFNADAAVDSTGFALLATKLRRVSRSAPAFRAAFEPFHHR